MWYVCTMAYQTDFLNEINKATLIYQYDQNLKNMLNNRTSYRKIQYKAIYVNFILEET